MAVFNMIAGGADAEEATFGLSSFQSIPSYSYTIYHKFYDKVNNRLFGLAGNNTQFTLYLLNDDGTLTRIASNGSSYGYTLGALYSEEDDCIYIMFRQSKTIILASINISTGAITTLHSDWEGTDVTSWNLLEYNGHLIWEHHYNSSGDTWYLYIFDYDKVNASATQIWWTSFSASSSSISSSLTNRICNYIRLFIDTYGRLFIYSYLYFLGGYYTKLLSESGVTSVSTRYLDSTNSSYNESRSFPARILPDKNGNALLLSYNNQHYSTFEGMFSFDQDTQKFVFRNHAFPEQLYSNYYNDVGYHNLGDERYLLTLTLNSTQYKAVFEQLYTLAD